MLAHLEEFVGDNLDNLSTKPSVSTFEPPVNIDKISSDLASKKILVKYAFGLTV